MDQTMEILLEQIRKLEEENKKIVEVSERVSSDFERHIQRHSEFVVFPLMLLPDEVILEIAEQLKPKHRRHLMQTCSKWHALLYDKRATSLDCRHEADINCTFEEDGNNMRLTIRAHKNGRERRRYKWSITAGDYRLTLDMEETMQEIERSFNIDEINVAIHPIPAGEEITQVLASFVQMTTKYFPTYLLCLVYRNTEAAMQRVTTILLDCPRSITLCTDAADYPFIKNETADAVRRCRAPLVQFVKSAAEKRGIRVILDELGAESDCRFRLIITDEETSLTISGAK